MGFPLMALGRPPGTARPPVPASPSEHVDPALGCFNGCGENRPNYLRTYQLVRGGKVAGHWRLCAECLVWGNPIDPRDTDPLRPPDDKVA